MKHKIIKMTFNEYDELVERLLASGKEPLTEYPPLKDLIQANELEDKSRTIFNYFVWLSETLPPAETDEEKEFKNTLNRILIERVKLYDEEDENDNNSGGKA